MKKLSACLSFLLLFALIGVTFAQDAPAVEEESCAFKPEVALTLDWNSRYVSKGRVINPDPIASIDAWIGLCGFYADFWAPFDMTDINRPERSGAYKNNRKYRAEEVDYVFGYNYTVGADKLGGISDLTIDFNYKYWQYPRANFDDDQLLELGLSLDNVLDPDGAAALKLGTSVAYHLNNDYAWWGTVYGDFSYKVNDDIKVGLKNTWYWGDKRFNGFGHDAVNAAELKLYASYDINKNISLGAYIAGAWAIDHDTRKAWDAESPWNRRQNFWGGVSVTFAF